MSFVLVDITGTAFNRTRERWWVSVSECQCLWYIFFSFWSNVTKLFMNVTIAFQSNFERSKVWQIFTLYHFSAFFFSWDAIRILSLEFFLFRYWPFLSVHIFEFLISFDLEIFSIFLVLPILVKWHLGNRVNVGHPHVVLYGCRML